MRACRRRGGSLRQLWGFLDVPSGQIFFRGNAAENAEIAEVSQSATILSMYSPQVLDHFQNPRNAGDVANADAIAQLENPACGDILKLSLKVAAGKVAEIRFKAKGCVPSIACGSAICELVQGKTLEDARRLTREDLLHAVGGLPEASSHASHLAMETLAKVISEIKR